MKTVASGLRRHRVTVQQPTPAPDTEGSFQQGWVTATPPTWQVAIAAEAPALERAAPGTTLTTGARIITGPYRADITTASRVLVGTRIFQVDGIRDPEDRHVELELLCRELVP